MNDIALGISHITDWQGYDHMLYLLALVARYDLRHAGKAALLATAFTVGHSLTLAIASLDLFRVPGDWVEFLIPVSIVVTALLNLRRSAAKGQGYRPGRWLYGVTVAFGLIHGLGFSTFFRISRDPGEGIVMPLLRFNLGVEIGQLAFLLAFLAVASLLRALGVTQREQQVFICAGTFAVALLMALERMP